MHKDTLFEILFLITAVSTFLWVGLAESWNHRITHPFPYSYLASDPFQHQTRAQWIKDADNYRYEAPYYSAGLTNVVGFYPPLLHHLTILLSHASGIEIYDAILLLTTILVIIGTLIMYLIIRSWNKTIAILSLPLTTYFFTIRETRISLYWGHWPALLGDFFLVATCWMLVNFNKKNSTFFLGILLAGTALGHTAATIFTTLFILFFFLTSLFFKRFDSSQFKKILFAFTLFLILSAYTLILFNQTWMVVHAYSFSIVTDWSGGGGFITLTDFGYLTLAILSLGFIFLIFSRTTNNFFQKQLAIFSLLAGFTNYIGFNLRAFNLRFYWPMLLSILFGTGMYTITRFFKKTIPPTMAILISLAILTLLVHYTYAPARNVEGLMNQYTWQALTWIRDTTPPDAHIFFFYGDAYDQDGSLGNTHRRNTRIEIPDFATSLHARKIERNYPTKELIESGTYLPYRKNWLTYGLHIADNHSISGRKERDLCTFDYYVFDKAGRHPALTPLNAIIANTFLQKNFTPVFENALTVILKNPTPGGTCLGTNNTITF